VLPAGAPGLCLGSHLEGVYALALSADGKVLWSASADCSVRAWAVGDLPDGPASAGAAAAPFEELEGHTDSACPQRMHA